MDYVPLGDQNSVSAFWHRLARSAFVGSKTTAYVQYMVMIKVQGGQNDNNIGKVHARSFCTIEKSSRNKVLFLREGFSLSFSVRPPMPVLHRARHVQRSPPL